MLFVSVVKMKTKNQGRNGAGSLSMNEKEIADYKRLVKDSY
jgi:hypothetical protein